MAGAILFVEDIEEKPYRLDRYLTQLRLAGALDGVRGVCIGQLTRCDDGDEKGADAVRAIVRALGVPAIEGVAAGHERTNLALPLGAVATLVAPAVSGVLLATTGPGVVFALLAACSLAAAVAVARVPGRFQSGSHVRTGVRSEAREGLRLLAADPVIVATTMATVLIALFAGATLVAEVPLA
jgi:hypothetical protein